MSIEMQITPSNLPEGFCPTSEQNRLNTYAQYTQVIFPFDKSIFNIGSTKPAPDSNTFPWFRLNNDGSPDNWYYYFNGYWIRPNPVPASSSMSQFWTGTLTALATYDGGEGNYNINTDGSITPTIAITSITGPMWEVNTYMQGRIPLGVSNTATIIKDSQGNTINQWAAGSQGGEIQHTQTSQELSPHVHTFGKDEFDKANSVLGSHVSGYNGGPGLYYGGDAARLPYAYSQTDETGGTTINNVDNSPVGFNVLNPYYAGYWVQRTARQFYRI